MKILSCAAIALLASGLLSGCGGGSQSAPVAITPPPQAAVTGVVTPKSVSVVTAN